MIELSRLRGSERYAACSDDVMAHRPYGSAQTGMYPFALYCGVDHRKRKKLLALVSGFLHTFNLPSA